MTITIIMTITKKHLRSKIDVVIHNIGPIIVDNLAT